MGTVTDGMGNRTVTRVPMDEAELSGLERGIITRARRAGYTIELLRGLGPEWESVRLVGRREASLGLVLFTSTRINGKAAEWWVKFRYWHPRRSTISEVRSELDYLIDQESRHLDGDLPLR